MSSISGEQFWGGQTSPEQADFRKFNEMLSRRGTGMDHVSIDGVDSNDNTKYLGPFTVKIKHDDGYEDEVHSDRHSLAMQKAALTVADNYAPELTSPELYESLKATNQKREDFKESLRPKIHQMLDEHAKTWATRRARLVGVINSALGTNLGPLDPVDTPEVGEKFKERLPGEIEGGAPNHPARYAFRTITGRRTSVPGAEVNLSTRSLTPEGHETETAIYSSTLSGDKLSGLSRRGQIHGNVPKNWSNYSQHVAQAEAEHKKWQDSVSKGLFNGTEDDKNELINDVSFRQENRTKSNDDNAFESAVGVENPYRNFGFDVEGFTPKRESTYEMYDGAGKKIHSGKISADYNTGFRDTYGVASLGKRLRTTITRKTAE